MAVRLIVKWEGTVPGLPEQRLSLNAFGDALTNLRASLRRIATNIVNEALRDRQADSGRLTNTARQLDIQLASLVTNSTGFESFVTILPPPGQAFSLFEDLPTTATTKLLDAIDAERQGTLTNASVRKYLASLPAGITRQSYSAYSNDVPLRELSFGKMVLAELPPALPYIAEYVGFVIGVGFEPGESHVAVRTEDNVVVTLTATPRQVETALSLRASAMRCMAVVEGPARRLLWLQESNVTLDRSTRQAAIFERWHGLLARLAN